MRNKEVHILYIMYIPKLRAYKVGISEISRINNRFKEIEKAFGKVNKNKSYMYHSKSAKTIKKIEHGIHTVSWEFSKEINRTGSGKTEFFKESIRPHLEELLFTCSKMYKLEGPIFLNKEKREKRQKVVYLLLFLITSSTSLYIFS